MPVLFVVLSRVRCRWELPSWIVAGFVDEDALLLATVGVGECRDIRGRYGCISSVVELSQLCFTGDFVALLQEVPAWGRLNGYTYSAHTILAAKNSDCYVN